MTTKIYDSKDKLVADIDGSAEFTSTGATLAGALLHDYVCPKHGNIGPAALGVANKLLCHHCYVEKLIEIGVCEVTWK